MPETAAYSSSFCRNTRNGLWAAFSMRIRRISNIKIMHTPIHIAPYWLFVVHKVCIPLHGCSDRYFLSVLENKAQISFSRYAHLLHRAVPQRFIKARNEALIP